MKKASIVFCLIALSLATAFGAERFRVSADRISADRKTGAFVATGHVHAVSGPICLLSELVSRDDDGTYRFADPTRVTSCTNDVHELHWCLDGEVRYADDRYVLLKNVWLKSYDIPLLWLPYWRHPLDTDYGLRVMPGYTKRWGAYLMTKYVYDFCGDRSDGPWLGGNTRADFRTENGFALGQTVKWRLGDFGNGQVKGYYAWDLDADRYDRHWSGRSWNYRNWGSTVPDERYAVMFEHDWNVTERDFVRARAALYSDSHFKRQFLRHSMFGLDNRFPLADHNEVAWEHLEDVVAVGLSVSGPLDDFYGGTGRLPELYVDSAPTCVFDTPVIYESSSRGGYLTRQYARYGDSETDFAFARNPGPWADYEAFRLDTYHRLTAPFRIADVLSVVPRVGYRGTFWSETGFTQTTGDRPAGKSGDQPWRSIFEGGITMSARGSGEFASWRHVVEPYLDILTQQAEFSGLGRGTRPYVFDGYDASTDWLDQFAGRSRNLPYSWYGATPGVRNAFYSVDESGAVRRLLDFDFYTVFQFNRAEYTAGDDRHRLARNPARPNYGESLEVVPGFRVAWNPVEDVSLGARAEYDAENNEIAFAAARLSVRANSAFKWYVEYCGRDHRLWDFAPAVYDPKVMNGDEFNWLDYKFAEVGFEHDVCDMLAWGPFVRWDCRRGELDEIGSWIDLCTDCLGFRFQLGYENEFEMVDGAVRRDDFSFGFYVYLRAFGPTSGSLIGD